MPIINQIRLFPPEEEWAEEAGDWGRGSGDGNAACPSRRHH